MGRPIKKGSTDQSTVIRIIDSTAGTPENAVEHDTSGIDLWWRREGETKTVITEVALASLDAAHSDGGIELIGDGYYRLDLPDAAVAAGSGENSVQIGGTVTGMIVIGNEHALVDYDPYDSVRAGLTALPNAAADAVGGLPISDAGGLDLDTKLANTNEVTAARMGALTDWINDGRLDLLLDAILLDTGTTLENRQVTIATNAARLTAVRAAVLTDLIDGGRLDLLIDAIKVVTDLQRSVSGTVVVNNPGTDTIFDLTAVTGTLSTNNDSCKNMVITFFDISGNIYETRKVTAFVGANGRVTIDEALTFPVDDGVDTFILWNKYSPTAAAGGGATAQEVHEYDVSEITTEGQAGYEIQQRGGKNSIYS